MFWWSIVRHKCCPTILDTLLIWDHVVLVANLTIGYDIDFSLKIKHEFQERVFMRSQVFLSTA